MSNIAFNIDVKDGHLVDEIARVMLGRFGGATLDTTELLERRCREAGDHRRAKIMRQVRERLSTGHVVDLVV
ncbi:MAG: hypothetical protein MI741_09715 [Rhodospirillales bacterium]|nr:hypothetical protein [Rhodospirillales bacterium]